MHAQVERIVEDLQQHPPPLPDTEVEQGISLLRWLADNHFTFLGYREYVLEAGMAPRRWSPCPAPASGSCAPTRPRRGVLPEAVASRARDKHLLVLAKANSQATVHRPVHLDYVGVKKFDDEGEVVGERAVPRAVLLGRLHRVRTTDPGAAREGVQGHRHRRPRPDEPRRQGPDGRARDLPARRAVPDTGRGPGADRLAGDVHPRAPAAEAVRAPRHLRPVPLLPGLPAARPLQHHGPRADRGDPQGAARRRPHRVHRARGRVVRGAAALRRTPAPGSRSASPTSPTSSGAAPRRPGPGATTSAPP